MRRKELKRRRAAQFAIGITFIFAKNNIIILNNNLSCTFSKKKKLCYNNVVVQVAFADTVKKSSVALFQRWLLFKDKCFLYFCCGRHSDRSVDFTFYQC
jgi:hypothetical protein